jgi:hypothetical protein
LASTISNLRKRRVGECEARQLNQQPDPALPESEGGEMKTLGYDQPLYVLPFDHRDFDDPGNFTMPAGYAEAKKIVFPEMASAIRKFSHEKFA